MYYFFDAPINIEEVNNLVEKLEGKEDIVLYFSTEGGNLDPMRFLIRFLNSLGDSIEIVLTDELCSAGTMLLTDYTGRLTHNGLDFILFHKWDRLVHNLRKSSIVSEDILNKQDEGENKIFAKKLKKLGLTKKQLKRFNKGKDVILYKDQFHLINL